MVCWLFQKVKMVDKMVSCAESYYICSFFRKNEDGREQQSWCWLCPAVWKVGGSLLGLWALLLVSADLFRDDCCVIIFVIRTVGAGTAFMNVVNVSHGDGEGIVVLDCEQIP